MAVISGQTRKQLRQSVGDRIEAVTISTTTSDGNSAGTTFRDTELASSDEYIRGRHWTDGTDISIINAYDGDINEGTLRTAASAQITSGREFELWDEDIPPARIHRYINEAIRTITRKGAPPVESLAVHSTRELSRYDLPAATVLTGIRRVEYRARYDREDIDNCDGVWSELVDADVTASTDSEVKRQGSASCKFVLGAGLGVNDLIATENVGTLDLSAMTHIEFWARSSVTTIASSLDLILSDQASGANAIETIDLPILTANEWQRVRVAMSDPTSATAIVSVALKYTSGFGPATVWIDGVEATREDSETWEYVHRNYWRIDNAARKLVFDAEGVAQIAHSLLKLLGAKKPTELTAETDTCDIEPEYIIAKATAMAMRASGDRYGSNRDAAKLDADTQEALARDALRRQQTPSGMRWID